MAEIIQETYEIISVDVGSSPGTTTDNVPGIDFITADNALYSLANRGANALEIPSSGNKYSYEKYIKFGATSVPSGYTLSNFKVWGAAEEVATGVNMYWRATDTYVDPVRPTSVAGFRKQATNYHSSSSDLTAWTQKQKILASNAESSDYFGIGVAIDGEYCAVGAYQEDTGYTNQGAVYIFTMSGGNGWTEQQKLVPSDAANSDYFGYNVDISGDYVIGGSYNKSTGTGAAYIWTRSGTSWSQQSKLTASDAATTDRFGIDVAIHGDYAIVGADQENSHAGAAYIFTRSGTTWSQQQKITAIDITADDHFGIGVDISNNYAIVGAYHAHSPAADAGAAYIFTRSGTNWTHQSKIVASDQASNDFFAYQVAIDGDYCIAGAYGDASPASDAGSVYVYTRSGVSWNQQQKLTASDQVAGDYLGWSLDISDDYIVSGANLAHAPGANSGAAYIYRRTNTTWTQQAKIAASDTTAGDEFGWKVGIYGNNVIVGALKDDTNTGSVYYFKRDNTALTISGSISSSGDYTNYLVAMLEVAPGAALNTVPTMTFNYSFDGPGQTFLGRFNGTLLDDISGDAGTFTEGIDFRDVKPDGTNKIADGLMITGADDVRFSTGNYINNANHCGKQEVNTVTKTDDALYIGESDFMCSVVASYAIGAGYPRIMNSSATPGFELYFNPAGGSGRNIAVNVSDDGLNHYVQGPGFSDHGLVRNIDAIFDRDGNCWYADDGIIEGSSNISAESGDLSRSNITIPNHTAIDGARFFNFGKDGLYVTGTLGNGDFEIRVGNSSGDALYDETSPYSATAPGGLIPDQYKSPYETLPKLGYSAIANANRTNAWTGDRVDFEGNTLDGWVTGGANLLVVASGEQQRNGTHSLKSTYINSTTPLCNHWMSEAAANKTHEVVGYTYIPSGWTGGNVYWYVTNLTGSTVRSTVVADGSVVDSWQRMSMILDLAADASGRVNIRSQGTPTVSGVVYFDDFSVKEIGEVAHWRFDDDLTDETDNNLTLTGSPTYTTSNLLSLKHREVTVLPETCTISVWIKINKQSIVTGRYIWEQRFSSAEDLGLYYANSTFFWSHRAQGVTQRPAKNFPTVPGGIYHVVGRCDRNAEHDGVNYMKLNIDYSSIGVDTDQMLYPTGLASEFLIGEDRLFGKQHEGLISLQFWDIWLPETRENAKGRGLPEWASVEGLYNSGAGVEGPLVNEHITFQLVDNPG